MCLRVSCGSVSCSTPGGTPGEVVYGGVTTAVCTCSLLLSRNVPSVTMGYGCGVEGKKPTCVCRDTQMGTYMLEQRCFLGSPECMATMEEPGWSGTSQQLLGQVVLCHGRGHALRDESCSGCLPSQRGRKSGRSREADPRGAPGHVQVSFVSYQHYFGKAAAKQRSGTGARAVVAV